ncbi:MAG: Na+/H+ antiporter subunit D [Candidatus Anammoxibacter sp.]
MQFLIVLPIIIPFATAIIAFLARRWGLVQRIWGIVGAVSLLAVAVMLFNTVYRDGIQSVQIGQWPAPYGITIVVDLFSAIMVVITGVIALAVSIYSLVDIDEERLAFGYFPLLHVLLMGINGAFITGDIFNLYVWFEVMLIASFVLIAFGGKRLQMEGALKYVTLNLVSSALFLAGIGILYGKTGTLNMADLAQKLAVEPKSYLITSSAMLFLVAFGIKAGVFPLFFWLPDSYHRPPAAVSAIFAGLLTKVGVYALIRVFTLIFVHNLEFTHTLIIVIAGFTMVTGVLGAVAQYGMRRLLAFHIISQIGYMIMGLGLFTPLALAGSVFYIIHHIIVKTNLFLISGVVHKLRGSYHLKSVGGLYKTNPGLAILFMIPALSLAGVPPLSGFFAKFVLIKAGLEINHYYIVAIALAVSLLTLFSMIKIWNEVFWKKMPTLENIDDKELSKIVLTSSQYILLIAPICMLAIMTITIGLGAEWFFGVAKQAAEQLLDPTDYINAVFGGKP